MYSHVLSHLLLSLKTLGKVFLKAFFTQKRIYCIRDSSNNYLNICML